MAPSLQVSDLSVRVRGKQLFTGVSFALAAGEILVVVGESGVGKTTLLRAIADLESYNGGVRFGDRLGSRSPVALVTQQPNLWGHLRVLENVALVRRLLRGESRHASRSIAMEELQRLGIGALAPRYPFRLSGGEQQRVSLARGLVTESAVLLLDEPTASLDPDSKECVVAAIRNYAARGRAVVVVTHDQGVASSFDGEPCELTSAGLSPLGCKHGNS